MSSHRRKAGEASLFTPTTTSLLRWWFGAEEVHARGGLAFTETQRQAIAATIARHEPANRQHRVAPPRHRVCLADDLDTVRVLLALLVWQLLNHTDARALGLNDPRYTRHFVAISPCRPTRERLLDALWGQPMPGGLGARDFGTADLVRFADLLIPAARRDEVYAFVCGCEAIEHGSAGAELLAITGQRLDSIPDLARLPHLMVFELEAHSQEPAHVPAATAGRQQLRRVVSMHGKPCMEVVFSHPTRCAPSPTRPGRLPGAQAEKG